MPVTPTHARWYVIQSHPIECRPKLIRSLRQCLQYAVVWILHHPIPRLCFSSLLSMYLLWNMQWNVFIRCWMLLKKNTFSSKTHSSSSVATTTGLAASPSSNPTGSSKAPNNSSKSAIFLRQTIHKTNIYYSLVCIHRNSVNWHPRCFSSFQRVKSCHKQCESTHAT